MVRPAEVGVHQFVRIIGSVMGYTFYFHVEGCVFTRLFMARRRYPRSPIYAQVLIDGTPLFTDLVEVKEGESLSEFRRRVKEIHKGLAEGFYKLWKV